MNRLPSIAMALVCGLTAEAPAAWAQPAFSDFWGSWGLQSFDQNTNEWQTNCAQQRSLLILTPDRIYTRGAAAVYKDYADCRVLNGSGGAALLIHAYCSSGGDTAENVMLEYDILSENAPLRIQRRGQIGVEYRKCADGPSE